METTLGKACILKSGKFIAASELQEKYEEGLFPCFGGNGVRGYVTEYSHEGTYPLIGRQGALCGNVNYASGKFRATEHAVVVQPIEKIDTRWLYYKLKAMNLGQYATGAAQPGLAVSKLEQLPLTIPLYEEQKRTAKMFDLVEQMIALRKEQLAKLDQLVKSRFIELFIGKGYPVARIKELLVQNSVTEKINDTKVEKFVTVGIKGKGAREREIKDGKWPVPFSGYRVKEGQFIYSRIDARNGAFAILPKEVDGAVVSKDFPVFDIKVDEILPNVLLFSVLQDDFVRQIQNSSFGATNRQRIQEEVFGEYTITLPPMEIQEQFTTFVEQTDKSKLAIQQSLDKLETLKKSLMQEYFG